MTTLLFVLLAGLAIGSAIAILLAAVLFGEAGFILYFRGNSGAPLLDPNAAGNASNVGLTSSIGTGLFTTYLLPFEITSVLLLMAIVGAMTLARRAGLRPTDLVVPGSQVLPRHSIDPKAVGDATEVSSSSTAEAARVLGLEGSAHRREQS